MTRAAVGTIAPIVAINGNDLREEVAGALIGMQVSCGLRLPSRVRLEFLDDGFSLSAGGTFAIGHSVTVRVASGDKLFTGEITGVELDVEQGAPNLTVIADDLAYRMTLGNRVATYLNMTFSDVVSKLVSGTGLKKSVTSTSTQQKYILQTDSDFAFVTEIADRLGYDWWVDPEGTFQFHPMGAQSGKTPELSWSGNGAGLRHFAVRASALHPGKVTVNGWNPESNTAMTATNKTPAGTPNAALVTPFLSARSLSSANEVASGQRLYSDRQDGQNMATSLATAALSGAVSAEGVCQVNAAVKVGYRVKISDVGPASGTYSVTEVEHRYGPRGFETRFVAGDRLPTGLVDTLTAPVGSSFRQDALVVGVVTNSGDSNAPKGHVKVKYPTLGDKIESAWARVVSMGAGDSRGVTFLPEVNDEVIVGFEGGDVSRPLVLGGLYSSKHAAQDYGVANGKVSKRQIVSRLGHVIEMGDGEKPGEQNVSIVLAGGEFAIALSKDGLSAKVPKGQPVTIAAGDSKIAFDKQGGVTIEGQKIVLKSHSTVEVSGMNIAVKAKAKLEGSGMELTMQGTTKTDVSSGGPTSIKGAVVKIN